MGLFDEVRVEMKMPTDSPRINAETVYQTKDFDEPYLEKYKITKDGRLLHAYRWDDAEWKPVEYHGYISLCEYFTDNAEWFEFRAKFTDSRCVAIDLVGHTIDGVPADAPIGSAPKPDKAGV